MDKNIQASGPSLSSDAIQAVEEGTANTRQSSNRKTIFKQASHNYDSNNIIIGGGGATSSAYKPESNSSIIPLENIIKANEINSLGYTTRTGSLSP